MAKAKRPRSPSPSETRSHKKFKPSEKQALEPKNDMKITKSSPKPSSAKRPRSPSLSEMRSQKKFKPSDKQALKPGNAKPSCDVGPDESKEQAARNGEGKEKITKSSTKPFKNQALKPEGAKPSDGVGPDESKEQAARKEDGKEKITNSSTKPGSAKRARSPSPSGMRKKFKPSEKPVLEPEDVKPSENVGPAKSKQPAARNEGGNHKMTRPSTKPSSAKSHPGKSKNKKNNKKNNKKTTNAGTASSTAKSKKPHTRKHPPKKKITKPSANPSPTETAALEKVKVIEESHHYLLRLQTSTNLAHSHSALGREKNTRITYRDAIATRWEDPALTRREQEWYAQEHANALAGIKANKAARCEQRREIGLLVADMAMEVGRECEKTLGRFARAMGRKVLKSVKLASEQLRQKMLLCGVVRGDRGGRWGGDYERVKRMQADARAARTG